MSSTHYVHREIYKFHHGRIPPNWEVHHIDGNHQNNEPRNLIALPKGVHQLVHKAAKQSGKLPGREELEAYAIRVREWWGKIEALEMEIHTKNAEIKRLKVKLRKLKACNLLPEIKP